MTLVLVLLCAVVACSAITTNEISTLKRIISDQVFSLDGRHRARAVRLSFHDCVGPNGCDGCVNLALDDNAGLDVIYNLVKDVYNTGLSAEQRGLLTFADFVALAGVRASEQTYRNNYGGSSIFNFKVGRPTTEPCIDPDYNRGEFPSALGGFTATVTNFLIPQFGLTEEQAIVLLGAHSLGSATVENSGFSKPWTTSPGSLDNEYYRVLQDAVTQQWQQIQPKKNKDNHPQWENVATKKRSEKELIEILTNLLSESERKKRQAAAGPLMMFNSDMCLYKQLDIGDEGISSCAADVSSCPWAATKDIVDTLANDNDHFITEYIDVFSIMIEKVVAGVVLEEATVSSGKKDQRKGLKKKALTEIMEGLLEAIERNAK